MSWYRMTFVSIVFCMVAMAGCSGNKCIPFSGKIAFDDGEPVTRGRVAFIIGDYMAEGFVTSEGTYQLSSNRTNDGVPPGTYKVIVTGVQKTVGNDLLNEKIISLIDPSYEKPETTPLSCEVVKGGEKTFDITVTRNKDVK